MSMRRILIALFLSLGVFGISAVPASARGGSQPHFGGGHQFRSFGHSSHRVGPRFHHRHHFARVDRIRHPHSVFLFSVTPGFFIPFNACEPVWVPGQWVWNGYLWVWLPEHQRCR